MINWSYDIEAAKGQGRILACSDRGDKSEDWVGFTWWLPDEKRWCMMGTKQVPLCWAKADHPNTKETSE